MSVFEFFEFCSFVAVPRLVGNLVTYSAAAWVSETSGFDMLVVVVVTEALMAVFRSSRKVTGSTITVVSFPFAALLGAVGVVVEVTSLLVSVLAFPVCFLLIVRVGPAVWRLMSLSGTIVANNLLFLG